MTLKKKKNGEIRAFYSDWENCIIRVTLSKNFLKKKK